MTTIILGLSALSIFLTYVARVESKRSEAKCRELSKAYSRISSEINTNIQLEKKVDKLEKKIESMKQTSSAWILEKEELINKLTNEIYNRDKKHAEFKFDSNKKLKETEKVACKWINDYKKLEKEKFNQLHELALMLNDSYDVDEILLEKAEKFDWLVNVANREQKRNFIKGCEIK